MSRVDSGAELDLSGIHVVLGDGGAGKVILADVSLRIDPSQVVALCGVSGVGKSTLLRVLAGLQLPNSGTFLYDGEPVDGPPRHVGYVVQDFYRSLFPWFSVRGNLLLALRRSSLTKAQKVSRVREVLAEVGLAGKEKSGLWELSGGMHQRVAIARALVGESRLLLMDEPFASVDAQVRQELEDLTLRVAGSRHITTVVVTHDIDEAIYLADRVLVLSGSPAHLVADISVPLPRPRTQLDTRESSDFGLLRRQVVAAMWPDGEVERW